MIVQIAKEQIESTLSSELDILREKLAHLQDIERQFEKLLKEKQHLEVIDCLWFC